MEWFLPRRRSSLIHQNRPGRTRRRAQGIGFCSTSSNAPKLSVSNVTVSIGGVAAGRHWPAR
jgi:hypothetical protein